MSKVVELKLDGNLQLGLQVNLAIAPEANTREVEISGNLPPAPQLQETYNLWQYNYRSLNSTSRISAKKITYDGSIQKHLAESRRLVDRLKQQLNDWLNSPQFQPIWRKFIEKIVPNETIRILIRTTDQQLRKLPWHLWELLEKYPYAEIALAPNNYEKIVTTRTTLEERGISVLGILGDSRGINIAEDKQILTNTLTNAELTFLCEPKREEISEQLWDRKWDILFFAGHSQTEWETGRIYINPEDSLSLEELSFALKKAVYRGGLKIAIFNSCDGLGLANFLEQLNLPQIIIMREQVPDRVAQQFLKYFLTDFASGKHFYLAVREARERLQGLDRKYPGASWQPIIVQNPGMSLPTWSSLAGISEPNNTPATKILPVAPQQQKKSSRRKFLKYGGLMLGGMSLTALLMVNSMVDIMVNITRRPKQAPDKPKFEIEPVKNMQITSSGEVWSLAISPDGEVIASGNNRGTIELFNRQTGDITKILGEHENVIRALVFIPQTNQLISGDGDGNINVWNRQNSNLEKQLQGHSASIWSLAISPDGQTLVSCSEDESIRIWNLTTGEANAIIFSHDTVVYALAFSPDGRVFASAGKDKIVKIWDVKNRTLLKSLQGHQDAIRAIAISPDGRYLVSASWDKTVKVWELESGELITTFEGHQDRVVTVAVSKDSETVFSGSIDNTIKVWSIKKAKLITTLPQHHNWVLALAIGEQENLLVSGGKDSTIKLWQYRSMN
ncbi:MAG: CHAT domain-containing protein [Xenococcaceae cyanobacterium MO_188.B32]|nr:CHAT domain-containing protein [Xenococcaceae cyanobacterium MO_188.B32]